MARPNPKCRNGDCSHPVSFHPKVPHQDRRPCRAFGCGCEDFVPAELAQEIEEESAQDS